MSYTRVNWQDAPSVSTPLSASNLNQMDAGIKKNADDIEQLQQHTYDAELDGTSTNAPQTKAVYEALQQINVETDTTLSVAGKAADAAATGEAVAQVKTSIDALKITDTASGAIASFPDGAAMPMESLMVEMEPIQDLHGQNSPYPAGGGKNKLAISPSIVDVETRGVSFTVNRNDAGDVLSIVANGTATARVYCSLGRYDFKAGTILSGCPADGSTNSYQLVVDGTSISDKGSGYTITEDVTNGNLMIVIASGYTCNNLTFKPMVRDASVTDATFAPYSNICPITGRDSVTVTRTGKNLLPNTGESKTTAGVTWTKNADGTITVSGTATGYSDFEIGFAKVTPDMGTIILSGIGGTTNVSWGHITLRDANNESIVNLSTGSASASLTFDISGYPNADTIKVAIKRNNNNVATSGVIKPQLELGSTATAYEPYTADSATIQLGTTVYGGTLDVTGGGTESLYASVDLGTLTYSRTTSGLFQTDSLISVIRPCIPGTGTLPTGFVLSSMYKEIDSISITGPGGTNPSPNGVMALNTNGRLYFNNTAYTDAAAFKTSMSGVQLVYELKTHQTIPTDPVPMTTLKGQNNVWSDADSVTVEYVADPKLYIARLTEPDTDMVADANITSGKYFMVGNNLYLATANIASGMAIVPGVNCTKTNLSNALNAINS